MGEKKVLTEAMGVVGIENASLDAVEQLNILFGEKSGTSYGVSYTGEVASNLGVQREFAKIIEQVDWNDGIRDATKMYSRRRCVYVVVSVVKPLAYVLAKRAEANGEEVAAVVFNKIYNANARQFKVAADNFYEAVISAAELSTPSRINVSVDDDYAATSDVIASWSKLRPKVVKISSIVKDILSAAGLVLGKHVSAEDFTTAVRWVFTYDLIRYYLHGDDDAKSSWYEPNASEFGMISNKIAHMADDSAKETRPGIDELTGFVSDMDSSDTAVKTKDAGVDERQVVKDMDNLGTDDMNQMTVVNEKSHATCAYYIPIFAISGLSGYGTKYGDEMKRLCSSLLSYVGANDFSKLDYPQFCEAVDTYFAAVSANTAVALDIRESIIERLAELVESESDKKSKNGTVLDEATHSLSKIVYGKNASAFSDEEVKHALKLADSFSKKVVYAGPESNYGSIRGISGSHGQVSYGHLKQPVVSFGEESTQERIITSGLSANGRNASRFFSISDGELTIQYERPDGSGTQLVDTIPVDQIKDVYKNYVSSSLVPVDGNWVVMKGIRVYAELRNGSMDDSTDISELTKSLSGKMSGSFSKTRVSDKEKVVRRLNRPEFSKKLVDYHFIDELDADSFEKKMNVAEKVYSTGGNAEQSERLGKLLTDVRAVCDIFAGGMSKFASSVVSDVVGIRPNDVLSALRSVAPTLMQLVSGRDAMINSMIVNYIKTMEPGYIKSSVSDLYSVLSNISKSFGDLVRMDASDNMSPTQCVKLYNAINNYVYQCGAKFDGIPNSHEKVEFAGIMQSLLPSQFDQIVAGLTQISDEANRETGNKSAVLKLKVNQLLAYREMLVRNTDAFGKLDTAMSRLFDQILSSDKGDEVSEYGVDWINRDSMSSLKDSLMLSVSEIEKRGITSSDVDFLYKQLARVMNGNLASNYETVKKMRVNQIVIPVKIMMTLRSACGIATKAENEIADADEKAEVSIDRAGGAEMGEVNPMATSNIANRAYAMRNLENTDEVTSASGDSVELDDIRPNIEAIVAGYERYSESMKRLAESKETIDDMVVSLVKDYNMDGRKVDASRPDEVLQSIKDNEYIPHKDAMYNFARRAYGEYNRLALAVKKNDAWLNKYADMWPTAEGVIHALYENKLDTKELTYMVSCISTATSILNNLVKYKDLLTAKQSRNPNADLSEISRRLYAFTESDDASIAQLIYVLGNFVCRANDDTREQLADSIDNVNSVIAHYSGNPMSMKASEIVTSTLESAKGSSDAEYAATVVKLICRLGEFLQSRTSDSVKADLEKVSSLATPANHSADYGKATDSFARSQIRGRISDSDTLKTISSVEDSEAKVRGNDFVDLLVSDMEENTDLAKYAYTLGKALDAFKRTVDDERMSSSSLAERPLNAIRDSFKDVKLYGEIGDNDLQRELISAVIDDERAGDKNYDTVKNVVNAARTGGSISSYSQMHSNVIGSKENILHDTKSVSVSFDKDGNKVIGGPGVALSDDEIGVLATGGNSFRFNGDIAGLVKAVRLSVFNSLIKGLGSVDFYGNATAKREGALVKEAIESLYKLCNDLDTPLSSIILAHSSIGHMGGRKALMKYAGEILKNEGNLDFDTAAMVSGEPNVFPQKYSSEKSAADLEWVDQVTGLLAQIPEGMSPAEVHGAVRQYCGSEIDRKEMMKDPYKRVIYDIMERLQSVDSPSGIPLGFYGDDKAKRSKTLSNIFNLVLNSEFGDMSWEDRARVIRKRSHDMIERGGNLVGLRGEKSVIEPSEAAAGRIAHLRMNPFYSVDMKAVDSEEFTEMVKELKESGYIVKEGTTTIVLKYPKMSLDNYLFAYIGMIAIGMHDRDKLPYDEAFDTALMCYLGEVRYPRYKELVSSLKSVMDADWSETEKKVDTLVNAEHFGGLVRTTLGWFTDEAYRAICIFASSTTPEDLLSGVKKCVADLTQGGVRDYDIGTVTRKPAAARKPKPETERVATGRKPTRTPKPRVPKPVKSTPRPETEEGTYAEEFDDGASLNVYGAGKEPRGSAAVDDEDDDDDVGQWLDDLVSPESMATIAGLAKKPKRSGKTNKKVEEQPDIDLDSFDPMQF